MAYAPETPISLDDASKRETTATVRAGDSRAIAITPEVSAGASGGVREAWAARSLLRSLGALALTRIIAGTRLGRSWLVIRPLMDSVGKAVIFGGVLKIGSPGDAPYFLFVLAGLLSWRLFERLVLYATRSFDIYRKLMRTFRFPLLLVPFAAMAYPALEVTVYWFVFLGALLAFWLADGELYLELGTNLLLVPAGMGLALTIAVGMGLWTSVLNGKARDVRYATRYVLPLWLYLTPVVYPLSAVPAVYRPLITANPLTAPVEMVKLGLLGAGEVNAASLAWSVAFAVLLTTSGLWFFGREAARSIERDDAGLDDDGDIG